MNWTREDWHTLLASLNAMLSGAAAVSFLLPVSDAVRGILAFSVFVLLSGLAVALKTAPPVQPLPPLPGPKP